MKTIRSFALLIVLLLSNYVSAPAEPGTLPVPDVSPHQLFYLQRSKDSNTVIYEANVAANQKLDPSKPVKVYWLRYAERGQREDLSSIQWQMAYGYSHKRSASGADAYNISLKAFGQRPFQVVYHQGKAVAMILINNQQACLQKVFVQLDPKAHLIPHVQFIELSGTDVATGQPVYERIVPN